MPRSPVSPRPFAGLLIGLLALSQPQARADSDLRIVCEAETSNETLYLSPRPGQDPFERVIQRFENGHRVAAQWLQGPDRLRTFVYDDSKKRAVLLSTQTVPVAPTACGQTLLESQVYTGQIERELNLSCKLVCGE